MIFHASFDARQPRHVAEVLAEIFGGGSVAPFPPIADDSWLAMAGDDRNTMIEVYPRGVVLVEADGDRDAIGQHDPNAASSAGSSMHLAIASRLESGAVVAIAERESWPVKYRKRGDLFGVLEIWIEGDRMLEVLTADMQAEYLATMTPANWKRMIATHGGSAG